MVMMWVVWYGDHQKHDAILLQDLGMTSCHGRARDCDGDAAADDVRVMLMM